MAITGNDRVREVQKGRLQRMTAQPSEHNPQVQNQGEILSVSLSLLLSLFSHTNRWVVPVSQHSRLSFGWPFIYVCTLSPEPLKEQKLKSVKMYLSSSTCASQFEAQKYKLKYKEKGGRIEIG